jgi:hypothetical protein
LITEDIAQVGLQLQLYTNMYKHIIISKELLKMQSCGRALGFTCIHGQTLADRTNPGLSFQL